jgi:hypothetical protein
MEQPRSEATGRYIKKAGGSTPHTPGGSAKDWVAKVLAHWNATRAKNPAYTYKEALIAMRGH